MPYRFLNPFAPARGRWQAAAAGTLAAVLALAGSAPANAATLDDGPAALVGLGFNENSGTTVGNSGTAPATFAKTSPPVWSANVPAGGGASSVDFGTTTGNYVVESGAVIPQLAGLAEFTVTGWVNNRSSAIGSGGNRIVSWIKNGGNGVDIVYKSDGSLQTGINQWPDGTPAISSPGRIPTDAGAAASNWRFFAVTYSGGQVRFYFGDNTTTATLDKTVTYNRGAVGTNIGRLAIGHFNTESSRASRANRMFRGLIDEVGIFGSALTLEQIQAVQSSQPTPPVITAHPQSQTVNVGGTATFSVQATGTAPLSYQWRHNGTNIAGATAASYTISNAQTSHAGQYTVVVSNVAGSVTSNTATLTVQDQPSPPVITGHPQSQTVNVGGSATFSVQATGTAPLSYQWRHNGANIAGATSASYTISNVQTSHAGQYSAVVSNAAGSVTSNAATLTVQDQPPPGGPVGWAGQPGKGLQTTTGGGNATPVVVTNASQLTSALSGSTPQVIHVVGAIQLSRQMYQVGSNKSIIGVGPSAAVVGGGLHLNGVSNVIIRNLTFRDVYVPGDWGGNSNGTDAVRADNSHHIWIDHNLFQRSADGLLDMRQNSDFITVSWNIFADHNKAGFVSGSPSNTQSKATIHHNWYRNLYQRAFTHDNALASHVFNNYYDGTILYAMNSRTDGGGQYSAVMVENNYFRYTNDPLLVIHNNAQLVHRGNIFGEGTSGLIQSRGPAWGTE